MQEVTSLVRAFYGSRRSTLAPTDLRSIGPICTAIEAHNPKRALLLSDQLLKRSPAFPSALALKSLALCIASQPLSTSAQNDIAKVVDTAKSANNGAALDDAEVLMLLTWALRFAGKGDEALDLMAKAVQSNPDNEELANDAFVQYLRIDDCKSAQQIAMKMSKQFQDERYLWWAILTTILQIRNLKHTQGPLLLSIAERLLASHYANKRAATSYATANEFHIVSRVLELRAQYSNATESPSLSSSSAQPSSSASAPSNPIVLPTLPPSEPPRSARHALLDHFASAEADKRCEENLGFEIWRREAELEYGSVGGGEWKRLWERLASGLREKGDTNWHSMLYMIRAACAIASSPSTPSETASAAEGLSPDGLTLLGETRQLLRTLSTNSPKANVERGYLLGLLEVARELRIRRWPEADKLDVLVAEYFDRFGTKACCFDDLLPYIDVLSSEELVSLRSTLTAATEDSFTDVRIATKAINAWKLLRRYTSPASAEEEHKTALNFTRLYFEALPLGVGLPPTELQPADDFALLAGQAWVAAYQYSKSRSYLERALALSEHILQKSKYKYQVRILAINLLRLLGASSLSLAHYRIFGVKNVQFDTLSHLVLARVSTYTITAPKEAGAIPEAASVMAWYGSGQREAREMSVRTFMNDAYTKVEDFYEFRQHLDRSLQQGLATVETLRMSVLSGTLDAEAMETASGRLASFIEFDDDTFVDHRDFKTLPNYQNREGQPIWAQSELGPRQDVPWLRTISLAYRRFLQPGSASDANGEVPSSCTEMEQRLVTFSRDAQLALVADLDGAREREQAAVSFFRNQAETFSTLADEETTLQWDVLHCAAVSLEAFLLLEVGVERRLEEMILQKTPEQSKQFKRLRVFRNAARDAVKPIGTKLSAYGKRVAKDRPKIVAALADLQQFEPLDENRLTNFAHALVDSRKTAADALGLAFNRRTAK